VARKDTHLLDKRRVYVTIGASVLTTVLPADFASVDLRDYGRSWYSHYCLI
jgi:hypothetical protein